MWQALHDNLINLKACNCKHRFWKQVLVRCITVYLYADDALVFLNIVSEWFKVVKVPANVCESWYLVTRTSSEVFCLTFIFLQTPLGLDYKDCLIIKNEQYSLPGVNKSFSSLKELTSYYQHNKLLLADVPVKLARCCPPRPKGVFHKPWIWYFQIYTTIHIVLYLYLFRHISL